MHRDKNEDYLNDALGFRLISGETARAVNRPPVAQGLGDLMSDAFDKQERQGEIRKLY